MVTANPDRYNPSARYVNAVLGLWLVFSAFAWRHSELQFTNAIVVGAACVLFALLAMRRQWLRFVNTALAVWLFLSAWALPATSTATVWNNVLVSIAIFIVSLIPNVAPNVSYRDGTPSAPTPA